MARGDGIHRTSARNARMKDADIGNAQAHNEREKSSYVNQDIVPERTPYNIHFKTPTAGYKEMFEQMRSDGVISTRGLKADAEKFGELIFDVNSAYFYNHGGYEFAKQFYSDAYKAAIKIVGGEQYILSAVMHADERNRAMSDALGQDVYHYHLHVVYIPIVEKQILWTKRCKDKSLVGTVKETIQQVSMSKKWDSKPALDENGEPILSAKGKPVLKKSYSVLQDHVLIALHFSAKLCVFTFQIRCTELAANGFVLGKLLLQTGDLFLEPCNQPVCRVQSFLQLGFLFLGRNVLLCKRRQAFKILTLHGNLA